MTSQPTVVAPRPDQLEQVAALAAECGLGRLPGDRRALDPRRTRLALSQDGTPVAMIGGLQVDLTVPGPGATLVQVGSRGLGSGGALPGHEDALGALVTHQLAEARAEGCATASAIRCAHVDWAGHGFNAATQEVPRVRSEAADADVRRHPLDSVETRDAWAALDRTLSRTVLGHVSLQLDHVASRRERLDEAARDASALVAWRDDRVVGLAELVEGMPVSVCAVDDAARTSLLAAAEARVERPDPVLLLRVTDVGQALGERGYAEHAAGEWVLAVSDELLPDVAGTFRLRVADEGTATCERLAPDAAADLSLSVAALAAVYLGQRTWADVAPGLGVAEHTPGSLAGLDAAFGRPEAARTHLGF